MAEDRLRRYRDKRDFSRTREPSGGEAAGAAPAGRRYLVQKHAATRLHFDFRLEHRGVLLSWAVTRGPSLDPADKRLAVHVEDHPIAYGDFEGTIPKGEYGGGTVMLWDEGIWEPVGDVDEGLLKGDFKFVLHGERLRGRFVLVRMKPRKGEKSRNENWLLIKERDEHAVSGGTPLVERALTSVRSGRTMEEIAAGDLEWTRDGLRRKSETTPAPAKRKGKPAGDPAPAAAPAFVPPQLATLADAPPEGEAWLHEIKYDGYRALAAVGGGRAAVYTRTGLDWSDRFRPLLRPLADLPAGSALIDGEVAVTDGRGHTDFGALQHALAERGGAGIAFYAFDLLQRDGSDLRRLPLQERKAQLAELLHGQPAGGPIFYADHIVGNGRAMLAEACRLGLEGIISKRADSTYRSGRSSNWLKIKCGQGQEFVIVGWEPSPVKGRPFASLLLAAREDGALAYKGRVGSGFGARELQMLAPRLQGLAAKSAAAEGVPREVARKARFVRPELVAEIAFRGWSRDGLVRQASFKGLRADKPAAEVVPEAVPEPPRRKPAAADPPPRREPPAGAGLATVTAERNVRKVELRGVGVTNPGRLLYPGRKVTKRSLAEYYLLVAARMLPHVAGRPLSIVRCPRGQAGECFFQKHATAGFPKEFRPVTIREKEGSDEYLYIEDEAGLVAAVQMGVLEFHVWGSHVATLEQPDRLVFDFDPDEAVGFPEVRSAAKEMRERLEAIGLISFAMATGGKGLHVVVPLTPRHDWDTIRVFAEAMARTMAEERPDRYLAVMSKAKRKGRIFIDYLRNGRGATAISPFSSRARPGAPVAWPLDWTSLDDADSAHPVTVETAAQVLAAEAADPWDGYFDVDQAIPLDRLGIA